jgi:hypothetical protein
MDDDFDNDVEMADDDLGESLGDDLGDLGEGAAGGDVELEFDDSSEVSGTRATGGARANARQNKPESVSVRAPRPPAPKAKKAATAAAKAGKARGSVKAAKKKSAPKKKAVAKKKAAPKKKAAKKPARKAGRKK